MNNEKAFKEDLRSLINRHGVDNYMNTPDFIITELLVTTIKLQRNITAERERWHGREFKSQIPSQTISPDKIQGDMIDQELNV